MSWSINTTLKNDPHDVFIDNRLQQLLVIDRSNVGNSHCVPERDQQIIAAMDAVVRVIIDGGFIDNADEISVSLSGHANKDHAEDSSWSNEFVSITINTKKYRPS